MQLQIEDDNQPTTSSSRSAASYSHHLGAGRQVQMQESQAQRKPGEVWKFFGHGLASNRRRCSRRQPWLTAGWVNQFEGKITRRCCSAAGDDDLAQVVLRCFCFFFFNFVALSSSSQTQQHHPTLCARHPRHIHTPYSKHTYTAYRFTPYSKP